MVTIKLPVMKKEEEINKLVDEALDSVNDISRAVARPYLLTRINARINKGSETVWDKAGWLIGRPAVAFTGLCIVLFINAMVFVFNSPSATVTATDQVAQSPADEFSYTVSTIYDFDNAQQ